MARITPNNTRPSDGHGQAVIPTPPIVNRTVAEFQADGGDPGVGPDREQEDRKVQRTEDKPLNIKGGYHPCLVRLVPDSLPFTLCSPDLAILLGSGKRSLAGHVGRGILLS
jgi:hypothetical protein